MIVGGRGRVVELIENLVKKLLPEDLAHGLDHVIRVRDLALKLGEAVPEIVDREILELAALLHDIGRIAGSRGHVERSAEIAKILLELANYPLDKVEKVVEVIRSHSFSEGIEPKSVEAKILSDADKLDALGAIGVARVFVFSGRMGRSFMESIKHFYEKILQLPNLMYTDVAKVIAKKRIEIVLKFLNELKKEVELSDVV